MGKRVIQTAAQDLDCSDPTDVRKGWKVAHELAVLFRNTEHTQPDDDVWDDVVIKLGHAVKTVDEVEGEIRKNLSADRRKKLLRLIEVQMWMRMFIWEDSDDPDFQWDLVKAALDIGLERPEPRERMINDLWSLAQLSLSYKIGPPRKFCGWLSKVLRVEFVTMDRDEDFDFVSDVLNHQFIIDVPEPRSDKKLEDAV